MRGGASRGVHPSSSCLWALSLSQRKRPTIEGGGTEVKARLSLLRDRGVPHLVGEECAAPCVDHQEEVSDGREPLAWLLPP